MAYGFIDDRFNNPYERVVIDVAGEGEVLAKPDIGNFSFSVRAEGEDAAVAQERSAEAINAILAYLKDNGVEEKDIKTQYYNLNPKYRYEERICVSIGYCPPGERVIDGYEVTQSVSVKVRNLDDAGKLISGVGDLGATNISGLNFTIDDTDVLEQEAREAAIADAKEKAERLAADLGMKVGDIVAFYDDHGGYYPEPYMARAVSMDMAYEEEAITVPELPTGENTIRKSVTISFRLK